MQSHIPVALGGRPSPFAGPLHAPGDPSRPSSTSVPSPFAQSSVTHSPFAQGSGVSSTAASRAISPRLSSGSTSTRARSPPSGTRSPTMAPARADHLRAPSLSGVSVAGLNTVTPVISVGGSVTPSNDDIEAVIQLAMASSPAGSASGRDTRTQLFVGNLPYRVRWQDLKDLFRRAGTVLRADVALGPDNRSRGHGTVLLASQEDAERAINMFQGWCWQGRVLEVRKDRVITGEEGMGAGSALPSPMAGAGFAAGLRSGLASPAPLSRFNSGMGLGTEGDDLLPAQLSAGMSRPGTGSGPPSVSRNLFVGNLPFHIQWQDLKDLFRQAGAVTRADVALGADARSRGFGTVSFSNEQDAERAVRMFNGYEYNGRALKVHFDKFSAPAATAQLAVPSLSTSTPHSPSSIGFQPQQAFQGQMAFAQGGSFAQQLLSRQNSQQQPMTLQRQGSDAFMYSPYDEQRGAEQFGVAQSDQNMQEGLPAHIPLPYRFEFLSSGPSTPYDWYGDASGMRFGPSAEQAQALQASVSGLSTRAEASESGQGLAAGSAVEAAVMQEQSRIGQALEEALAPRPSPLVLDHTHSVGAGSKPTSQDHVAGNSLQQQTQSASQSHSQSGSQSGSHSTPHQHHPAHPGPIALPPPPPVTAFPVPPPHTLSPQYYSPIMHPGHPHSPYHHPAMAMGMGMAMTPHGLPPITPSMPSFSFVSQPSPAPQDPSAPNTPGASGASMQVQFDPARHMPHHIMTPFQPFSPGVTMSPGAFWGRPGSGAVNPFINPAVGAPVHGSPGYYWPPRGQPAAGASLEEQGYFPPVPPQPQPEESYFPSVPPSGSRPSGLANELGRGDSGSGGSSNLGVDGSNRPENGRSRSGHSEATTTGTVVTDATGTGSRPTSSQGTSWQTDVDSEGPDMSVLEKGFDALAVADEEGAEQMNGAEHAKPRAYSAQTSGAAHPPPLARAGSDPVDVRQGACEPAGGVAVLRAFAAEGQASGR